MDSNNNIIFDGNIVNQTTRNQSRHCVNILGSSNITIKNCMFQNIISDGIYISSSGTNISSNVDIYDNSFLGNNTNRNGISIINCKDSKIHHNYFYKMSRDDMPGSIDLEPNASTDVITDILINDNIIIGGGTPTLQHGISIDNPNDALVTNVSVLNNNLSGVFRYGISIFGETIQSNTKVLVKNNNLNIPVSLNLSCSVILSGSCDIDVSENDIDSTTDIGIKSVGSNYKISSNKIKNCLCFGIEEISAIGSGKIEGNLIEDCGGNIAAQYGGIHIRSSYLDIINNKITSSVTAKTQTGIYIESRVKNFIHGNISKGLGIRALNVTTAPQVFGQNIGCGGFNSISGIYPPTSESWVAGDKIFNPNPIDGGVSYWECVVAGTPGTWRSNQIGVKTCISITPLYIGEVAIASEISYITTGITSISDWKQITN